MKEPDDRKPQILEWHGGLTPIIRSAIRVTLCHLAICTEIGGRPGAHKSRE